MGNALRFSTRLKACGGDPVHQTPPGDALFEGRLLGAEVSPGLFATGYDLTYLQDRSVEFEVGVSLTCGLLLEGAANPMRVPGHDPVTQIQHQPVLFGFGAAGECSAKWRCGQRCAMGGFSLRPNFFERFGETVTEDGLAAMQGFFRSDFRADRLRPSPQLSRMATASINSAFVNEMEALFLESSTLAMVVEVAALIDDRQRTRQIPARHRRMLMLACEKLDADIVCLPTTVELAREVGTNVTTLQRIFRQSLGTTILGYVQKRRLEVARVMLQERAGSIGEIGHSVGYASASAFSAAYRRHFGRAPSAEG
ncbi:AraC family transcriptional regulator [Nitratireductor aquibiodomus RA22]|uniref:AraC family transcriptional regulator n=1 Tax=Nitratireductor aquibiodomus RA22 TaxID=1189611 RepID=I5BVD0_9HYPH|nr:AraC family transcriptional regulator [Nitratireductor aquibiodomus]EIM73532.1 AraC family transcriptional regulator [Nitratireductor aquibiodomus RA22]